MSEDRRTVVTSEDGTPISLLTLGSGPGLVVVGGALQSAEDYLGLARALSAAFTVHVYDRRGRGKSGPHGEGYSLTSEHEDLLAVQAATSASAVFGHSYGGLVVLASLAKGAPFATASVYEPGVSLGGSIPIDWVPLYRSLLARGDAYGAFAHFIKANGQSPAAVRYLPHWYLRTLLHAMPGFRATIAPRLEGNALEHEQIALRDDHFADYRTIRIRVQLLAGSKSPRLALRTQDVLAATIPEASSIVVPGLEHRSPLARRPIALARLVTEHLLA